MKSLDKILNTFNKTLKQLDALIDRNDDEATRNFDYMAALEKRNTELYREASRAEKVRTNLLRIIGEDE